MDVDVLSENNIDIKLKSLDFDQSIFNSGSFTLYIGIGIALYGLAYFIVHEIIIHQRIKILSRINNKYVRGIRMAHKVHHKNINKENGTSFGMLIVSLKYFK